MLCFKIRDKVTGLFATPTHGLKWNKKGKIWKQWSHVTAHINLFEHDYKTHTNPVEIVSFTMIEGMSMPITEALVEIEKRKKELEQRRNESFSEYLQKIKDSSR